MMRLPIAGPSITELEIEYVTDAVRNDWYHKAGNYLGRFEQAFAKHTGRHFAISLPSCTSALHLALAAAGVGFDDEVVVPDCTWIASAAPISYVGAKPVFVDIDPSTWCLSPEALESAITPRTRAVIVVDLYGQMPNWDAILKICARHGLIAIEDSAEAVGSTYKGRPAGSFGLCSAFSFHGSKTLTTGEGGMLVCDDAEFYGRVQKLRDHGRAPGDVMFRNDEIAFKYKMSPIQAALGLAQLERLEELVNMKRSIFAWYREMLAPCTQLSMNPDCEYVYNSYWMSTVLLEAGFDLGKEDLFDQLRGRGIDVRPFFYPLSALPAYKSLPDVKFARERNCNAYAISRRGVNLPSALSLTKLDVARVCEVLVDIVQSRRISQ